MGKKNGFTIMEILILLALIGILTTGLLIAVNPMRQFSKGWDARRKADLSLLNKAFEDYYNDHGCYPTASDVCYDTPIAIGNTSYTCHVCGNNSASPSFKPYIDKLPCDPQAPQKNYLYQYQNADCSSWYNAYSEFALDDDRDSQALGCAGGSCGPAPRGYDYGVSSPNTSLNADTRYACLVTYDNGATQTCGSCTGDYTTCDSTVTCSYYKKYYSSALLCCQANPTAVNCNWASYRYCLCGTSCTLCGASSDCAVDERCCRPVGTLWNNSCCRATCP